MLLTSGLMRIGGQRPRGARELQSGLLQVVEVEMGVARGVDELARLEPRDLGHHLQQQGVGGDVERHTEEGVGRPLVELEREASVGDIKLEEAVARRQRHVFDLSRIPRRDEHSAGVGIALDHFLHLRYLVYRAPTVVGPRPPLVAIDRTEVAVLVGPLVPDAHAVVLKPAHVGVATQKPQQLVDDGLQVEFLGREQREAVLEVVAHLVAEDAQRARARAVALLVALGEDSV